MLRTWFVRLRAIELTLSVRPFQAPATPFTCACPPSLPSVPTSRATRVTSEAKALSWSTMALMVSFSSSNSPFTSTVIFFARSPRAMAVVTSAMLRTWLVRFEAMKLTLSVISFQTPPTPSTCACPPSFPSVPTSRATRVTSEANALSWSTIVLIVSLSWRISPFASTVKGEIRQLKDTINTMVDQLKAFASEVTRVAREVGTEGKLGGQAQVEGVGGVWKDLTDNVNFMASNLTNQVRNIADVTTAIARGDLAKKITVEVKGELLELKETINAMVDQLNAILLLLRR